MNIYYDDWNDQSGGDFDIMVTYSSSKGLTGSQIQNKPL
jgi:hypothetical protein